MAMWAGWSNRVINEEEHMSRRVKTFDELPLDAEASSRAGFGAIETARGRLPVVALDVRARIFDVTAETTVRQTFFNACDEPLEATYIFPLPDRAAVTKFQMHVAGRTIEGELKERGEAREEYDRAIEKGHRAAIAEEERSGVFTMRVGNLPPREEATVELTLVGPLPVADGEATFRFPLVVAPRYTPGVPLDGTSVGQGVVPDTDQVPDASRVTPPVLLPGFPNPVRLSLEVQIECTAIAQAATDWRDLVTCSLHEVAADEGLPWTLRVQPGERLNRDFILRFPVAGNSIETSLETSPAAAEKSGVFALTLLPPKLTELAPTPRRIVFLLDRSGSMEGWKMVAARRALGRMIDSLLDHDEVTVLAFDSAVESFPGAKQGFVLATDRQRWELLEWLGKVEARGGTEIGSAIDQALSLLTAAQRSSANPSAARQPILVLVTDGQVTGEDVLLRQLASASKAVKPRVFTVGIDQAVNAGLLQRLADAGHGACELVESEDRLDEAMNRIHRLIGTPVLTNVRVESLDTDLISVAPQRVPDLFADRPVVIYGRHGSTGGTVRVQVSATDAAGKAWRREVEGKLGAASKLLSCWGRAMVRDLEDAYAAGGQRNPEQLMKRIVDVSLESHVLSRFTAYVAVDRSEVVNPGGKVLGVVQPVEMPAGWDVACCTVAPAAAMPLAARGGGITRFRKALNFLSPPAAGAIPPSDFYGGDDATGSSAFLEEPDSDDTLCDAESGSAAGDQGDSIAQKVVRYLVQAAGDGGKVRTSWIDRALVDTLQRGATELWIEVYADRIEVLYRADGEVKDRTPVFVQFVRDIVQEIAYLAKPTLKKLDLSHLDRIEFAFTKGPNVWGVRFLVTDACVTIVLALQPHDASRQEAKAKRSWTKFWA